MNVERVSMNGLHDAFVCSANSYVLASCMQTNVWFAWHLQGREWEMTAHMMMAKKRFKPLEIW